MENSTTSSPSKRRAALAPLDANALSSPSKPAAKGSSTPLGRRMAEAYAASAMIAAAAGGSSPRPVKRVCLEGGSNRSRSRTPEEEDESSLFDNNDNSWATNTTPDVSPAPRILTRDEAREKAEILRLRLGLAGYKVRTGQTSVPLANLVAKPLPRSTHARRRVQQDTLPTHKDDAAPTHKDDEETRKEEAAGDDVEDDGEEVELPPLRRAAAVEATPRRREIVEEDAALTSSALRGGAASGLLSLARGGSSD